MATPERPSASPGTAGANHAHIAAAYDALAERWRDAEFPQHNGVAHHRHALALLGQRGGAALNVGCGCNTRFNDLLREHGLSPEGIDLSARMVELARAADSRAPIHHADICIWPMPRPYAFISAWDSIWHVALEAQRSLLLKLMGALVPGGVLLFTAGGLDAPAEHYDGYMGPELYYASLGIPALLEVIAEGDCICRHLEFDQLPEKHLVVIAQRSV
ncbi:MAG: class I SAM-dependent methyltransferase [Proteobacteria bacterium]|nr:class I SAM-dependent methyltransferase [Pseudomonadota bacterium]